MLLDNGVDVNATGGKYGTALQAASFFGEKSIVQRLLNKGADVNATGGKYGSALKAASIRGHKVIVQMLLDRGADDNAPEEDYGNALQAPLFHATNRLVLKERTVVHEMGGFFSSASQVASS